MKKLVLAAIVAALAACASMEMKPGAAEGIAASNAKFAEAFNSGNAAGVAALYTADASVLPPNADRIDGRAAIQALWQSYVDAKLTRLVLKAVTLDDQGDTATELGTFAIDAPDGKGGTVTARGKYVVLWKRGEDGVWRLKWDIWNDDSAG